jgi:hypothetical protein
LAERGATEAEVIATVEQGERLSAKLGRTGFRRNFMYQKQWRGRFYTSKQISPFADQQPDSWPVMTAIVRYFSSMKLTYHPRLIVKTDC